MRTAITLATPHDGATVFLSGPSVPIQQQKDEIKKLKALREHAEYAEVQLWESGSGIAQKVKFQKPKAATPAAPATEEPPTPPADAKRKK